MTRLSTTSMVAIHSVSAAKTTDSAAQKPKPALIRGRVDSAYPKRNAKPIAKAMVATADRPSAVPTIRPMTSPRAHPVRQCSVALAASALRGLRRGGMTSAYPQGVYPSRSGLCGSATVYSPATACAPASGVARRSPRREATGLRTDNTTAATSSTAASAVWRRLRRDGAVRRCAPDRPRVHSTETGVIDSTDQRLAYDDIVSRRRWQRAIGHHVASLFAHRVARRGGTRRPGSARTLHSRRGASPQRTADACRGDGPRQ